MARRPIPIPRRGQLSFGRIRRKFKITIEPATDTPHVPTASPLAFSAAGAGSLLANLTNLSDNWSALDGRLNAPTGAANYPNLLDGYAVRPPWWVAGVDYRVGINTGITLKNPETEAAPAGTSKNTTTNVFTISSNNVVFDGWDFTDWQLLVNGDNPTIKNCLFDGNGEILFNLDVGQSGGTVEYCEFQSIGATVNAALRFFGQGDYVVRYCLFDTAYHMHAQWTYNNNGQSHTTTMKYNIFKDAGGGANFSVHGDYTQCFNVPGQTLFDAQFNTCFQTEPDATYRTQGFSNEDGSSREVITISHNTFLAPSGTNTNFFALIRRTQTVGPITIQNNYMDPTETVLFVTFKPSDSGPQNPNITVSGNINMLTGASQDGDTDLVGAEDNFNRASLGSNWTTATGFSAIQIVSASKAAGSALSTHCVAYWSADTFGDDQYAECTITDFTATAYVGLTLRHQVGATNSFYACYAGTDGAVAFYKWTAGSAVLLGSASVTFTVNDVLRFEASGSSTVTLIAKKNGTEVHSVTDSTSPFISGLPGLDLYNDVATFASCDEWHAWPI